MSLKILYIIATVKNSIGGHYYSLETTAMALSSSISPQILVIGNKPSSIFNNSGIKTLFIEFHISKLIYIIKQIKNIIKENNIDVIHAFDYIALLFARLMHHYIGIPYMYTRCGGANPRKYFPFAQNIILYSEENLHYFRNHKKYNKSEIFLIPNRVKMFLPDLDRIECLKRRIGGTKNDIIILRISRISSNYLQTFKQIVHLADTLMQNGLPIKLVIIGKPEEDYERVIKELDLNSKPYIFLITDDYFATNAKEIIGICKYYVGTGRGLMEACSQKKIVLTPLHDKIIPAIIDESNFKILFKTNFSERNELNISEQQIYVDILNIIKDKNRQNDVELFSYKMFIEHFDITAVLNKYLHIYGELTKNNKKDSLWNIFDLIRHITLICQAFYLPIIINKPKNK